MRITDLEQEETVVLFFIALFWPHAVGAWIAEKIHKEPPP